MEKIFKMGGIVEKQIQKALGSLPPCGNRCRFSESLICSSRVHPPSEIKSNFKFKTLRWRPLRWRLTLSDNPYNLSKKYGSTPPICSAVRSRICIAVLSWLLSFEERETLQCASHLYCSAPPICTTHKENPHKEISAGVREGVREGFRGPNSLCWSHCSQKNRAHKEFKGGGVSRFGGGGVLRSNFGCHFFMFMCFFGT